MADKIAYELEIRKKELAGRITELHFSKNPDLEKKYGERGRQRCFEDAIYHIDYLVEAVRMDSTELFNHYLEWAWYMLEARNIPREDLVSNLGYIKQAISEILQDSQLEAVFQILDAGNHHLQYLEPRVETHLLQNNPLYEEAGEYLRLLLDARREQAAELIDELVKKGTSVQDIYEHIFQATQYEIGALWHQGKVTVANEHYCTAATQLIMSRLYPIIFSNRKHGLKMVACSVSSELHELGIRMVSDIFEMDGWDTYYMGSNMPDAHLVQSIRDNEADLLAISVTLPIHIGKVKSLIDDIRSGDEFKELKIIAGGYPFGIIPDLQQYIGADATAASAGEAIEIANKLVG